MTSFVSTIACGNSDLPVTSGATKGAAIYHQDDPALFRFEVLSGVVRTIHLFADGRRQLIGFFYKGEVFGADQGFYRTSAEVVSDEAEIRRTRWGDGASDEQALAMALELAENSLLLLGRRTALARVAAFLADVLIRTGGRNPIPLPMSRIDIADYLGLTVETVSRTFNQLIREGLIAQTEHHCVEIIDLEQLNALASLEGRMNPSSGRKRRVSEPRSA
jgi:CRP/FNR family nitrogen fixation transcriptional regulator